MFTTYQFKNRGIGIISTSTIPGGSFIGTYIEKGVTPIKDCVELYQGWVESYPLGRYVNHSFKSNLYFKLIGNKVNVYSKVELEPNQELTVNYLDLKQLLNIPNAVIDSEIILQYLDNSEFIEHTQSLI